MFHFNHDSYRVVEHVLVLSNSNNYSLRFTKNVSKKSTQAKEVHANEVQALMTLWETKSQNAEFSTAIAILTRAMANEAYQCMFCPSFYMTTP